MESNTLKLPDVEKQADENESSIPTRNDTAQQKLMLVWKILTKL